MRSILLLFFFICGTRCPKRPLSKTKTNQAKKSKTAIGKQARPEFDKDMIEAFQLRCTQTSQFGLQTDCTKPKSFGNALCHVFSWNDMHEMTVYLLQNILNNVNKVTAESELTTLITALFDIDSSAIVSLRPDRPPLPTEMSHQTYLGPELIQMNDNKRQEAFDLRDGLLSQLNTAQAYNEMAAADLKNLFHILNSAPANLRYGRQSLNAGIKRKLDPMGNILGYMTTKERNWHKIWDSIMGSTGKHTTLKTKTGTVCSTCIQQSCDYAARSSSTSIDGVNWYVCT